MANLDNNPLGTVFGGILAGWGLILGPLAALMVGIFLGLLAAGVYLWDLRELLAVVVLGLPLATLHSVPGFVISLAMLVTAIQFVGNEERRVERLLLLCGLAEVQVFVLAWTMLVHSTGVLALLRILAVFLGLPAIYVGLRLYAARRFRELERQLDEDRQARLRQ